MKPNYTKDEYIKLAIESMLEDISMDHPDATEEEKMRTVNFLIFGDHHEWIKILRATKLKQAILSDIPPEYFGSCLYVGTDPASRKTQDDLMYDITRKVKVEASYP
jgi:hypothetical protein